MPAAVRIELVDGGRKVRVRALRLDRLTSHGFATFLKVIEPGEISITLEALHALLRCRHRPGLSGLEISAGNTLAWATHQPLVTIDLSKVSRGPETDWFVSCCVVEAKAPGNT